jgi:hypothetical protein
MPTPDKVDPNSCILNCDAGRPTPPATGNQSPPTATQAPTTGQQQSSTERVTENETEQNPRKKASYIKCNPNGQPDADLQSGLMNGGVPGPETTAQGALNDCWVIASIMGFQMSEAGRAGLAKMITASPGGGYDVRFGKFPCKPIHVDKVFSSGATQSGGQGAVTIMEGAFYNSASSYKALMRCTGYFSSVSQSMIKGSKSDWTDVFTGDKNTVRDRLTGDAAGGINSGIQEGRSVVVGTAHDSTFTTAISTASGYEPSRLVTLQGKHQYVVVKAASDGVWVRNPWGSAGASADGGGEIWVPKDQIANSFSDLAVSGKISDAFGKDC